MSSPPIWRDRRARGRILGAMQDICQGTEACTSEEIWEQTDASTTRVGPVRPARRGEDEWADEFEPCFEAWSQTPLPPSVVPVNRQ
jgi:hypothetical protein